MQLKIRKGFILVMLVIVVIVSIAVFLFFVEVPMSFVDKFDWETYHNDRYGYEFKYPKNKELEISEDEKEACVYDFCVGAITSPELGSMDICPGNILVGWKIATLCIKSGELDPEYIYFQKNNLTFGIFSHSGPNPDINRDILSTFKFVK